MSNETVDGKIVGHSAHSERTTRLTFAAWPRLMDLATAAAYTCLGISTLRDYCADGILRPISMPGSTLRDRNGRVIARSKTRRIHKILVAREDLDALIDSRKGTHEIQNG